MWERLYKFMDFLNRKIEKYPNENYFTVEMDVDLYHFANQIGFISDEGWFTFQGKKFGLG